MTKNLKHVYIEPDRYQAGKYTVFTSTNGGQMKTGIFTGMLHECSKIAAAFADIGYQLGE